MPQYESHYSSVSPNNPTGNASRGEILRLADAFDGITVVDEAYIDFA